MTVSPDALRALPSVERLLGTTSTGARNGGGHAVRVQIAREVIDDARARIRAGHAAPELDALAEELSARLAVLDRSPVRRVINATGVIIHTNLGRAPLSAHALEAVAEVGRSYSNLEYEIEAGTRGSRHEHCQALIQRLTGAPASVVVNNNAAAVLLALAEVAVGREVIVSRGELVEIGGGFRIPDVLRQSGARLVEVGTTNRTYAADYAAAAGPETAALLRVHSSNFRVVGFTHRPTLEELVAVGRQHDVTVIEDLGSGSLLDTTQFGLAAEPTVQASLAAGVDLVCFSGDKLLGGPQAGIIAGRVDLVGRIKRHPLMRALRPDKLTIAALAATLTHYVSGDAFRELPVWRMMATPLNEIETRARCIADALGDAPLALAFLDGRSAIGGGALPEETLPTRLLALKSSQLSPTALAERLRLGTPPVVARIENDAVVLDLRTVDPAEDAEIIAALRSAGVPPAGGAGGGGLPARLSTPGAGARPASTITGDGRDARAPV